MKRKTAFFSLVAFTVILLITSCSKDNEEEVSGDPPTGNNGGACDTVNIKYASGVLPILQANCYSCHGNGASEGGVKLDNFSTVQTRANNGSLLGVITHAQGFPAMPKNGTKLSDCNINKIRSWIKNGAQNN